MATVTPRVPFDRAATDRRVRHPLHSLRGYIRTYVLLEGAAVAVIYLALWFWIGLALDYVPFRLFAFDWVEELNGAVGEGPAFVVRAVLLGLLVLGLLAVVAFKVVTRLLREFSDPALALVLERRFPRELGDRVITAVELADPRLSARYGYSQDLIDHTIRDAAERVERVPVRQVFDWKRLWRQGFLALLCSLGLYLLVFLGYAGYAVANDSSPGDFVGRFNNVAAVWGERNLLLMNTYWPRQAYLEVLRFQDAADHKGEMRVARDEQRPDLLVRAIQWVVADRAAEGGWRPLRWQDLPGLVDDANLLEVPLPADWGGWVIDLDDLDPSVTPGSVPAEWNGKTSRLFHAVLRVDHRSRKHGAATPPLKVKVVDKRGRPSATITLPPISREALPAVEHLLDWHNWTLDQIALQLGPPEKTDVRHPMRRDHPEAYRRLEDLFTRLNELAEEPGMARRLRKLEVPDHIVFSYRGNTTKGDTPFERGEGNKYLVGLGELKESVRFTFRGEDYYTAPRNITLVPPPGLTEMTMDKEEPAYIYWRLQGSQLPLKGRRQQFKNVSVSIAGTVSNIEVPVGTSLELHARSDRPLQDNVRMVAPANPQVKGGVFMPPTAVPLDADGQGFRTGFRNVTRPVEFELLYFDLDGVKGRRHVVIDPRDDRGPQEAVPVEGTVVLRQPRPAGGAGKATLVGFLVTPDAALPFKGTFTDEYGLTDMRWKWHGEEVEFELMGRSPLKGDKGKEGGLVLGGNTKLRRAGLVVSGLQGTPSGLGSVPLGPVYWSWLDRLLTYDLAAGAKTVAFDGDAALEFFAERLKERDAGAIPADLLAEKLQGPAPKSSQLRSHSLDRTETFDFRKLLPRLKSNDPSKEAQLHYRVQLFVTARDNNVETGNTPEGTVVQNKVPLTFLVVSENELLAQILLEEEVLRERLEKAVGRLNTGKTILDEQAIKLQSAASQLSLVGLRADEVRKLLTDASSATREVSSDYNRILREMEVNRVAAQRVDNVREKICKPLEEALTPGTGHFAAAENPVSKLWEGIEEDLARLKKAEDAGQGKDPQLLQALEARRQDHLKATNDARESMGRLIAHLDAILQSIGGELVEREIIALLLQIERDQRDQARYWADRYTQVRDDEINRLTNPGAPK
jgi:hypothetical protein